MADDDNHILQPHSDEKPSHNIADHTRPLQTSVFSNGKWYNIGNTLDFMNAQHDMHKVAKVVEQHQVDITNAEKEANNAHSEAQSAIQVSKANSAANSAMSVAVDNIHSLANSAATDALHATSNANIAESSANTALSSANIAYSNADTALTSAEKALSTANFANSTAHQNTLSISSTASEMALKANKTDLDKLNGTVDSNSTEISVIAGQIKSKADQTDIDMVKKTVSSNSTEIDQLATGITSKANSQDVDMLKKTVSDHSTEISQLSTGFSSKANASDVNNLAKTLSSSNTEIAQLANQITTKANQQDVNNLKRTVDTHTTELSQTSKELAAKADQTTVDRINNTVSHNTAQLNMQAGQISSKVDSTTVNGLIDERGYATTSAVQSWINQKSDTINETITRLDDKVNTTGGGVNLARNTKGKESVGRLNTSNNIGGLSLEQWNDLRGKTITISVDTQWSGWSSGNNRNRIGWEICLIYQDGKKDYFGPWTTPKTANGKDRPHITCTVRDEEIKSLDEGASYIQANCSSAKVSNLKIELGSIATPYSSAPSDDASVTQIQNLTATIDGIQSTVRGKADQSTVTQLSNVIDSKVAKGDYNTEISQLNHDINLRVQKGQTISQINQEAGGNTLIEVNNGKGTLALDASTVTFSGKAFIPSAAITTITADQVQTGILKGDDLAMNLNTGEVEFAHGHIGSLDGNFDLNIDEGTMYIRRDEKDLGTEISKNGITFVHGQDKNEVSTINPSIDSNANFNLMKNGYHYKPPFGVMTPIVAGLKANTKYHIFIRYNKDVWEKANHSNDWSTVNLNFFVGDGNANLRQIATVGQDNSTVGGIDGSYSIEFGTYADDPNSYDASKGNLTIFVQPTNQNIQPLNWIAVIDENHIQEFENEVIVQTGSDTSYIYKNDSFVPNIDDKNANATFNISSDQIDISAHNKFSDSSYDPRLVLRQNGNADLYSLSTNINFPNNRKISLKPESKNDNAVITVSSSNPLWFNDNIWSDQGVGGSRVIVFSGNSTHGGFDYEEGWTAYYNGDAQGLWVKNSDLWVTGTVKGRSWQQLSELSEKTNISKLDPEKALETINHTGIYDYQYKDDVKDGKSKHYASLIIDDVHDDPEYDTPSEFLGEDHHYRDDGTQLAYLTAAVQLIDKRLKKLEDK